MNVLNACIESALQETALFVLVVDTGTGMIKASTILVPVSCKQSKALHKKTKITTEKLPDIILSTAQYSTVSTNLSQNLSQQFQFLIAEIAEIAESNINVRTFLQQLNPVLKVFAKIPVGAITSIRLQKIISRKIK